jgi:hypothetical protein
MHENDFSVITSRVNISWRGQVFWPTKGTGGLQHHIFLFLMENSIPNKSDSVDVKITPLKNFFCSESKNRSSKKMPYVVEFAN